MVTNWVRGGIVAVALGLAGATAHAATVTDATVDVTGSYLFKNDRYRFVGDFTADLVGNPKKDRAYDLGMSFSFRGKSVLLDLASASDISDDPFSIKDVLKGDVEGSGFVKLLRGFDLDTKVTSKSGSAEGSFKSKLGESRSDLLRTVCMSVFNKRAEKKCEGAKNFALTLIFTYEIPEPPLNEQPQKQQQQPAPSPVPLPAGLPLLGAGLATFAALRRTRR